jgi:hypothetical protein
VVVCQGAIDDCSCGSCLLHVPTGIAILDLLLTYLCTYPYMLEVIEPEVSTYWSRHLSITQYSVIRD